MMLIRTYVHLRCFVLSEYLFVTNNEHCCVGVDVDVDALRLRSNASMRPAHHASTC